MRTMLNTPDPKESKKNSISPLSRHGGIEGIKVQELRRATPKSLKEINNLLPQLSKTAKPISLKMLDTITRDKNTCLVVAREDLQIIGMGSLVVFLTPHSRRARIEDVVVDEKYRGRGIGEKISKELIALAKKKKVKSIELSSRPRRTVANELYKKLGFKKKETNTYSLSFR